MNNRLANTTYDAMGNQTQLSVSAGTVASYDAENRMAKIAVGGSEIASYTYDAEGRRVAKTAGGATTYYVYDAFGQLMAEYGGPAQTAGTRYFTTDYLGSTRMILNGTGGCVERLDYAPFGGQISRSGQDCYGGASSEKPLFTGQMRDGESTAGTDTGQDYFNALYFWANTARFTSPDAPFADQRPADGQSWNMYAYVRNNPLRYVDFMGRECLDGVSVNMENDEDNGKFCFVTDVTATPTTSTQTRNTTSSVTEDEQVSVDDSIMALLPNGDRPLYGLFGEGALTLKAAGDRSAHDVGCVIPLFSVGSTVREAGTTASARVLDASLNVIPKHRYAGIQGSTTYTSEAATAARNSFLRNWKGSFKAPVGYPWPGGGWAMRSSGDAGAAAGRWAPYAGTLGMAVGAAATWHCLSSN